MSVLPDRNNSRKTHAHTMRIAGLTLPPALLSEDNFVEMSVAFAAHLAAVPPLTHGLRSLIEELRVVRASPASCSECVSLFAYARGLCFCTLASVHRRRFRLHLSSHLVVASRVSVY